MLAILTVRMSKRPCPFDESCEPQYKVRISEKQVTETNKKSMENVWNQTRDLLFEAAKRSTEKNLEESIGICHNCHEDKFESQSCSFCSNNCCSNCIKTCIYCTGLFCSHCSILIYVKNITESICLSCVN